MTPEDIDKLIRKVNKLQKAICCLTAPSTFNLGEETEPDETQTNSIQYNDEGDIWYITNEGVIIPLGGAEPFNANVRDYGAVGDGVTDDSAAFTAAIATTLPVEVPPGDYLISSEFTLNNGQRMFGYGRSYK